jgi:hypothetical protein
MTPPIRKQRRIISDRVDRAKPASIVIDKFGGLTRFCELTGYPTSTAHGWMVSGYIPAHRKGHSTHAHILGVAQAEAIELAAGDFVEQPTAPAAVDG